MRPFEDLIKEITIDGETFIPLKKIAMLACNYNDETVCNKFGLGYNSYYGECWCRFNTNLLKPRAHQYYVNVLGHYNISKHMIIDDKAITHREAINNQVEIFKLLTKWGFI
jgi:hypothetical protein